MNKSKEIAASFLKLILLFVLQYENKENTVDEGGHEKRDWENEMDLRAYVCNGDEGRGAGRGHRCHVFDRHSFQVL